MSVAGVTRSKMTEDGCRAFARLLPGLVKAKVSLLLRFVIYAGRHAEEELRVGTPETCASWGVLCEQGSCG